MTEMPPPGQPQPVSYATPPAAFNLQDFLTFKTMITGTVIKFLFIIGAGLNILVALIMFVYGLFNIGSAAGWGTMFMALIWLVLGPFLVRIQCELLMVIFRINDTLSDIKTALERR